MKPLATAAAALGLALLSFFVFPGHTWLQQDTQIYLPILEHLRNPAALRNDILAQQPHVAFTLYDEAALVLRSTGLSFEHLLAAEQIATRGFGIWGLWLLAGALGLPAAAAWLAAGFVSLGAMIAGPQVLTFEYEPTPRAFAVPLLVCGMGLLARRRYLAASFGAAAAFLYHPPTALPFWAVLVVTLAIRRRWRAAVPLGAAAVILVLAAQAQAPAAEAQTLFARLAPFQERLQRMRTAYVFVSEWPRDRILHHLAVLAVLAAAWAWRRRTLSLEANLLLLGLPLLGLASMPLSWLLLEHWKWALVPQVQPLRMLLFVTLAAQILCAVAGAGAAKRGALLEAGLWFFLAVVPSVHSVADDPFPPRVAATLIALAAAAALAVSRAPRWSPAVALAAVVALPTAAGVVNYPRLRTPELRELSAWAASETPPDAVFLFADAPRSLDPGIFRAEALRAVYVDWKGGGQINYLRAFADDWWFRWHETLGAGFHPAALLRYEALGITWLVLRPEHALDRPPQFRNEKYVVYGLANPSGHIPELPAPPR